MSGADHARYIAETCEIGGAYETSRKGVAAICKDAEGDVQSAELLKVANENNGNFKYGDWSIQLRNEMFMLKSVALNRRVSLMAK